ncbi:hypothetical protein N7454_009098 [Penicillium verhagenii]|nr:hypothetical protein N7454_009098 [Penicillium verhagenii]
MAFAVNWLDVCFGSRPAPDDWPVKIDQNVHMCMRGAHKAPYVRGSRLGNAGNTGLCAELQRSYSILKGQVNQCSPHVQGLLIYNVEVTLLGMAV